MKRQTKHKERNGSANNDNHITTYREQYHVILLNNGREEEKEERRNFTFHFNLNGWLVGWWLHEIKVRNRFISLFIRNLLNQQKQIYIYNKFSLAMPHSFKTFHDFIIDHVSFFPLIFGCSCYGFISFYLHVSRMRLTIRNKPYSQLMIQAAISIQFIHFQFQI